jgi:serine/threonine protein phosphatase PrpC
MNTMTTARVECLTEFGMRTDTGRVRVNNEDCLGASPELRLFVLSDGMGGLAAGEVASRLTVEVILAHCHAAETDPTLEFVGWPIQGVFEASSRLASAVHAANRAVHQVALDSVARKGMGATVVAVQFLDDRMSLAHVGDSRAYRLRCGDLEQLTQDHSLIAEQLRRGTTTPREACHSPLQSVLLRAVGVEPELDVEINEEMVMEGDTVLLCSDGLTRELSDAQIAAILRETEDLQETADCLVRFANLAGGGDNVSAIVIRPALEGSGSSAGIGRIGKWFRGFHGNN